MKHVWMWTVIGLGMVWIVFVLTAMGTYSVQPHESAIVVRLGEIQRIVKNPGVHFKIPILEMDLIFSEGRQSFRSDALKVDVEDEGHVTIRGMIQWQICEPEQFFVSFGHGEPALERVNTYLDEKFRAIATEVISKYPLRDYISGSAIPPIRKTVNSRLALNAASSGICMEDGGKPYELIETSAAKPTGSLISIS